MAQVFAMAENKTDQSRQQIHNQFETHNRRFEQNRIPRSRFAQNPSGPQGPYRREPSGLQGPYRSEPNGSQGPYRKEPNGTQGLLKIKITSHPQQKIILQQQQIDNNRINRSLFSFGLSQQSIVLITVFININILHPLN